MNYLRGADDERNRQCRISGLRFGAADSCLIPQRTRRNPRPQSCVRLGSRRSMKTLQVDACAVHFATIGRFVSIVQGSVMRFNFNNPAFEVLPKNLPSTRRPIGAISLKARTLSPVARMFIDCAHEVAKALPR